MEYTVRYKCYLGSRVTFVQRPIKPFIAGHRSINRSIADTLMSDVEEEYQVALEAFPKEGPRHYIFRRVHGEDVLQNVKELKCEGGLEVSSKGDSALLYAKFGEEGGHGGEIRAIMYNIDPEDLSYNNSREVFPSHKKAFFRADASTAWVDYGVWNGPIHRSGGLGCGFIGQVCEFGAHYAEAGKVGDLAEDPWSFRGITALISVVDEPPIESIPEEHRHLIPPEFKPLPKGTLLFTLYFDDGSGHYGKSAPIPLNLMFEPVKECDATVSVVRLLFQFRTYFFWYVISYLTIFTKKKFTIYVPPHVAEHIRSIKKNKKKDQKVGGDNHEKVRDDNQMKKSINKRDASTQEFQPNQKMKQNNPNKKAKHNIK